MDHAFVAKVSATINAPKVRVWNAFLDPATIEQYMFGTNVVSDWRKGSPSVWGMAGQAL
jgi:uncharacterized protein YndB with AHSA1/START domain